LSTNPLDPGFTDTGARRARVGTVLGTIALLAAFALGLLMFVPPLFGYERCVITGASMSGSIERGSIVYAKPVRVDDLEVGDVITYTPPRGAGPVGKVTHRIVWAGRGESGARAFRTKGDNNEAADPWKFELDQPTQAVVAFDVPYVGYALAALGIRWVRMLVIGLPAALIVVAVLAGAWREAGALADATRGDVAVERSAAQ
jgi:signal peptidase